MPTIYLSPLPLNFESTSLSETIYPGLHLRLLKFGNVSSPAGATHCSLTLSLMTWFQNVCASLSASTEVGIFARGRFSDGTSLAFSWSSMAGNASSGIANMTLSTSLTELEVHLIDFVNTDHLYQERGYLLQLDDSDDEALLVHPESSSSSGLSSTVGEESLPHLSVEMIEAYFKDSPALDISSLRLEDNEEFPPLRPFSA